jgi:hypothetical protein
MPGIRPAHAFSSLLLVTSLCLGGCGDGEGGGDGGGVEIDESANALCVDTINQHRASISLPPYARWREAEECSGEAASSDASTGQAHGAFGHCGESAQNECPGWSGAAEDMIVGCLQMMWDEGPGDFAQHGHYTTMASTSYTQVACGFHTGSDGSTWSVQNFR